ncbi:MAG: Holliday junction branch migration protein RuvA [Candidatus Parcubacteria bacterium]|nr:Holliday junction branch migration protein RuvA [Candidatus Parcubacteria bacterium]
MISFLKGKVQYIGSNFLEVNVNDLGYKVFVTEDFLHKAKVGKEIEIFTHQHVREDALDLFGFDNREQMELFEKLIGVSGIGPKTALNVLSAATIEEIETAVIHDDVSVLTKVSGIGAKTAERLVLELKNKYKGKTAPSAKGSSGSEDADVIDALIGLGYGPDDARTALRQIDKDQKGVDEKLKACLKLLGK